MPTATDPDPLIDALGLRYARAIGRKLARHALAMGMPDDLVWGLVQRIVRKAIDGSEMWAELSTDAKIDTWEAYRKGCESAVRQATARADASGCKGTGTTRRSRGGI